MDEVEKFLVHFGTVACDNKPTKSIRVKNDSTIEQHYKIEKFSNRPALDSGFHVQPAISPAIKPGEEFSFEVKFIPKLMNIKCCEIFKITHRFGIQAELITKAIATGPECSLSSRKVKINCPAGLKKYSKQVDLVNNGQCRALFQFVIDIDHPTICVQPRQGVVAPFKQTHIVVTYTPKDKIPYFKRVCCLIANHKPIFLDIYAVCLKSKETSTWNTNLDSNSKLGNGYDCFMHDIIKRMVEHEKSLITLNKSNINFGHCQSTGSKKLEFMLTNNSDKMLYIVWIQNNLKNVFTIHPSAAEVESQASANFYAEFKPVARDMIYGELIEAVVLSDGFLLPLPYPIEINLKGDSFQEHSCGWAPQYYIEPLSFDKCEGGDVVLPPIIANSPLKLSYATMVIHRRGHLPLAFQFHPPVHTNFSVKPEQGLINGSFQIIVVMFNAETSVEAIVTERWLLSFNSNETVNPCIVKFGSSIEAPRLIINRGNDIVLPSIHPGTEYRLYVCLFNPTRLFLQYNLEVERGTCVLSAEDGGEIWPQEYKWIPLMFHPKSSGCLESSLKCYPQHEFGKTTSVVVRSLCSQTELKAEPEKIIFQKVIRDFKHERSFKITNIGEAIIKGILSWDFKENYEHYDVSFKPESFILEPGDSIIVEVAVTPFTVGKKELMVYYYTTISEPTVLLKLIVDCLYPTLKIADLAINFVGPLFAKFHYWKMMQINKLNQMLVDLRPNEPQELHMYLPSFESSSRNTTIDILVENDSEMGTTLSVCPVIACDCQPVLRQVSFSLSKRDHNCPHRKQVQIVPENIHISAKSYSILKMTVSYKTVGKVDSHFVLSFVPEDYQEMNYQVNLTISRIGIGEDEPFLDTTELKENGEFVFLMKPIYIGNVYPIAQGFHLYNNTKYIVKLEVDDQNLIGTPFKYIKSEKYVPFFSNHFLLFTFLPYCSKIYEAEVTILINDNPVKLTLRGEGVGDQNHDIMREMELPKDEKLNKINPPEVYFSKSHLDIGPIKPECSYKSIFFIINNTKDLFSFKFHAIKLSDIKLRVHPSKGVLEPESVVECRLTSSCHGWPCHLVCPMVFTYTNFSRYSSIVKSLDTYYDNLIKSHKYFVITEKGKQGYYVVPPEEEWPLKNHLTIGFTIDVRGTYEICDEENSPINSIEIPSDSVPESIEAALNRYIVVDVLERLIWQAVNEGYFDYREDSLLDLSPDLLYAQLRKSDTSDNIPLPENIMMTTLEEVLYFTLQDCFELNGSRHCEQNRRNRIRQLQSEIKIFKCFSPQNSNLSMSIPTASSLSQAASTSASTSASVSFGTIVSDNDT